MRLGADGLCRHCVVEQTVTPHACVQRASLFLQAWRWGCVWRPSDAACACPRSKCSRMSRDRPVPTQCPHSARTVPTQCPHSAHSSFATFGARHRILSFILYREPWSLPPCVKYYKTQVGTVWALCGHCVGIVWALCGHCLFSCIIPQPSSAQASGHLIVATRRSVHSVRIMKHVSFT